MIRLLLLSLAVLGRDVVVAPFAQMGAFFFACYRALTHIQDTLMCTESVQSPPMGCAGACRLLTATAPIGVGDFTLPAV